VRNELEAYKKRIKEISEFYVKIHKDNIAKIKSVDTGLISAVEATIDHFDSEYAEIRMKFDYKKIKPSKIKVTVNNIISYLLKNKEKNIDTFNTLTIKAQDGENDNKLEIFDLLVDRVKSRIKVEKNERHRTVVSIDIYDKMKSEMNKKFK
jgi:hypothetical protein